MSLLKYLKFQEIDSSFDDITPNEHRESNDDEIELERQVDENELESYWDSVVDNLHQDPTQFSDELDA